MTGPVLDIEDASGLDLHILFSKRILRKSGDLPSWHDGVHQHQTGLEFLIEPKQPPRDGPLGLSSEFHPRAVTKKLESRLLIINMLAYTAM